MESWLGNEIDVNIDYEMNGKDLIESFFFKLN